MASFGSFYFGVGGSIFVVSKMAGFGGIDFMDTRAYLFRLSHRGAPSGKESEQFYMRNFENSTLAYIS